MPTDYSFRTDDDESLLPARPEYSRQNPKELVECSESRSRMLSFQHGELLPKNQVFQEKSAARIETAGNGWNKKPNCAKHGVVLSKRRCGFQCAILLNQKADRLLANDR